MYEINLHQSLSYDISFSCLLKMSTASVSISNQTGQTISLQKSNSNLLAGQIGKGIYDGVSMLARVPSPGIYGPTSLNTGDPGNPNTLFTGWLADPPKAGQMGDFFLYFSPTGALLESGWDTTKVANIAYANNVAEISSVPAMRAGNEWWIWGLLILAILAVVIFIIIFAVGHHKVPMGFAAPGTAPPGYALAGVYQPQLPPGTVMTPTISGAASQ